MYLLNDEGGYYQGKSKSETGEEHTALTKLMRTKNSTKIRLQ